MFLTLWEILEDILILETAIGENMKVKYPNITVELSGHDGNAFAILERIVQTLRKEGVEKEIIEQFREEAKSGDYDDLLETCMEWVNVE